MGRLDGRSCVLTGAAGGIGRATAARLAAEGARLLLSDLDADGVAAVAVEVVAGGADAHAVACDVTRDDDLDRLRAAVEERFGGLDVLVNNHGAIVGRPFLEATDAEWDAVHGVVLRSVFTLSRRLVPLMLGREGASVVNLASVGGIVALGGMSAYGAAKAGVIHLSKVMAVDLAPHGIRVNAVCPGVIDTPQPRQFVAGAHDPDAAFAAFAPLHVLGRVGRPEEVADAILYLASQESSFVTASAFIVDGGMTAI